MSDSSQQPTGTNRVAAAKSQLRARLLAARRSLSAATRHAADQRIQDALGQLAGDLPTAGTVTGYVPVRTEPGGADLPAVLAARVPAGVQLLLPVLLPDRSLDWARYDGRLLLRRGLVEPAGPRLGPAAVRQASLLVVPAVAVDRHGMRLGRGGGSYDRALELADPAATVIALLHDGELVEPPLPAAAHDRRVNAVITPGQGLVRFGP